MHSIAELHRQKVSNMHLHAMLSVAVLHSLTAEQPVSSEVSKRTNASHSKVKTCSAQVYLLSRSKLHP